MRRLIRHRWTSLGLLFIGLAALVVFLYGFFPLKYHSGKLSHMDDLPNFIDGISIDGQQVYNSGENSVVLMVIDGLRYDFLTEEYMPYAGQLLKNKSACIYVAVAEPPTVTMPRIKSPERKKEKAQWRRTINFWRDIFAMMTGSVSTFADVALNFGAPAVHGDSVLRVANIRKRKTVMYGDDTWLRLFPGLWTEYDGTTSFFVTDYTEVDNNVTRHLDKILAPDLEKKPTFDFLVLHYLGLDHIGHLEGARSPKIKPKLLEMDEVVKKIFTAMQQWDHGGVLLVCGDHGMRDAGGHGGASASELLVPLLLARSNDFTCPHPSGRGPTVSQVDVAPSVSWLLGAPPPGDSVGRVLPALLPRDPRQHLYLLHVIADHNSKLLPSTDTEFYKQFKRAEKQFAHYLVTGQKSAAKISKEFYEESLEKMAEHLAETTTNFDMFAIGLAIALLFLIATALLCVTLYSLQPDFQHDYVKKTPSRQNRSFYGTIVAFVFILSIIIVILVTLCFITETKSQICSFTPETVIPFALIAFFLTITYFIIQTGFEQIMFLSSLNFLGCVDYLLIGGTVFHCLSFFGTSFIEEEHMTWYFLWNTLMFFILLKTLVILVRYLGKKRNKLPDKQNGTCLGFTYPRSVRVDIVPKWVLLIALHRYLRSMNQTGDRWQFLPDTADWLNAPENAFYLEAQFVIGAIATLAVCLSHVQYMHHWLCMHKLLTTAATVCIFCYRLATHTPPFEYIKTWDPVIIVNVFWSILLIQFVFEIFSYLGAFRSCSKESDRPLLNKFVYRRPKWKIDEELNEEMKNFGYPISKLKNDEKYDNLTFEPWHIEAVKMNLVKSVSHLMLNDLMLIIVLLMRPHNVIMVPSIYVTCVLTSKCVDHQMLGVTFKKDQVVTILSQTIAHIWIGMLFFFYQGNSNSLASVDLGAGYVGLREYSAWRVAARMGLHAYAGPALAGATLFAGIAAHASTWPIYSRKIWRATSMLALHRVYGLAVYCVVATVFRHHLFVWTVFSPKLLYDFVATVFSVQALGTIALIEALAHITNRLARICAGRQRP